MASKDGDVTNESWICVYLKIGYAPSSGNFIGENDDNRCELEISYSQTTPYLRWKIGFTHILNTNLGQALHTGKKAFIERELNRCSVCHIYLSMILYVRMSQ